MLFGPGAGGTPTASAVIGDIISIVNTAPGGFLRNCVCYKDLGFFPNGEVVSRFYVRLHVVRPAGRPGAARRPFGDEGVSIESMVQSGAGETAELVFVLHPVREAAAHVALERIGALPVVHGTPTVVRVEGDYAADAPPWQGPGGGRATRPGARRASPVEASSTTTATSCRSDGTPIVTLGEGDTPLVRGTRVSVRSSGSSSTSSWRA